MGLEFQIAKGLSIALFLGYGVLCLFANGMVDEFERYGLARFRRLTGALEVLGALGLAGGYLVPFLDVFSAAGLVALMALGVGVRVKVGDPVVQMIPAAFLLVVNAFIAVEAPWWAM